MNSSGVKTSISVQATTTPSAAIYHRASYGSINISGNARVQLGDKYGANQDLFESGTLEERRTSLLNLLYYDGLDLKREQIALSDVGPRSFAWVEEETGMPEWLESETRIKPFFWINGKPGSGKSTLMKHLAESRSVLTRLRSRGENWTVIHFFFDYRAGTATANKPLGMLKLFLRQLSLVKEVKELLDRELRDYLAEENVEKHIDVLAAVLRDLRLNICAFIDGLDEYEGDLWDLSSLLETLQDRTGMKICLASRPEPAFEQNFATFPSIVMQEHNSSSIRVYARQKISKFLAQQPFIDEDLFPDELLSAVSEKAQGIILWARLVVDEMIKSCTEETVKADLFALLKSLPPELEALYERILDKTNQKYRAETAAMLHILIENDSSMKAATLFQVWDYIKQVILQLGTHGKLIEFRVAEARLKALLGNLVDFVRYRNHLKKPVTVRLLHRSLSTYLARTDWVWDNLSDQMRQCFPNCFNRRLSVHCIKNATQSDAVLDFQFEHLLYTAEVREREDHMFSAGGPLSGQINKAFSQVFQMSRSWTRWTDVYLHAVDGFFSFPANLDTSQIYEAELEWPQQSSAAAITHFVRCALCKSYLRQGWHWYIVSSILKTGDIDLLINLIHGFEVWVLRNLTTRYPCQCEGRWENPDPQARGVMQDETEHHDAITCSSNRQLFRDLLTVICYRDAEEAPPPNIQPLQVYLRGHVGYMTPVCMFDWNSLLPHGADHRFTPLKDSQDRLVRFFELQNCSAELLMLDYAEADFRAPIVSCKTLGHHPACPLAKTSSDALIHWLRCKSETRIIFDPTDRPDTDRILWNFLRSGSLCPTFQNLRQKFRALAEAGAVTTSCKEIVEEAKCILKTRIDRSRYPRCGVCSYSNTLLASDVTNLLNDIVDVFTHCQIFVSENTSATSTGGLDTDQVPSHQMLPVFGNSKSPTPFDKLRHGSTTTPNTVAIRWRFPSMRQRNPLECCVSRIRSRIEFFDAARTPRPDGISLTRFSSSFQPLPSDSRWPPNPHLPEHLDIPLYRDPDDDVSRRIDELETMLENLRDDASTS